MDFRNKNIGRLSTTVYFLKEENVKHRNYVTYRINLNLICRYHLKLFFLLFLFSFRGFFNLYLYSSIFIFKLVSKSVNKVGYIWPHCRTPMRNRNRSCFFATKNRGRYDTKFTIAVHASFLWCFMTFACNIVRFISTANKLTPTHPPTTPFTNECTEHPWNYR